MAKIRKIRKSPPKSERNYFIVDACFLVEKYLPISSAPEAVKPRMRACKAWWKEIDRQVQIERARVYIPDLCIAEAFKVLAKKYYVEDSFPNSAAYKAARDKLSGDVSISRKTLKAQMRFIGYHDVPATRDIIVAVDRFFELFHKHNCNVGVIDLIVVATAKYMIDFYDAPRDQIHIVTLDNNLRKGCKKVTELPNAYDPTPGADDFSKVFV